MKAASQDGMTEVEMSKMALAKSSNATTKDFANRMVQDHTLANMQRMDIAEKEGVAVIPKIDSEHAGLVKALGEKSGADFDKAYSTATVNNRKMAVATFQNETADTSHSDLQSLLNLLCLPCANTSIWRKS